MLQTKFRENQPAGSGEEDFEGFLPCMGVAAILTKMPQTNLRSPNPRRLQINLGLIGQAVYEKKMFEIVYDNEDGRTTDGHRTMSIL